MINITNANDIDTEAPILTSFEIDDNTLECEQASITFNADDDNDIGGLSATFQIF